MSLPSPFRFLEWRADTEALVVEPAIPGSTKRWGLVSVDGVLVEDIVRVAKENDGDDWLPNFAMMLPNYVLMATETQADTFVITGNANMQVEDLETHEIEELCDVVATEEAFDASVERWKHDPDSAAGRGADEGRVPNDSESTSDDTDQRQAYMEKRQLLDHFAAMFDLTNKLAKRFQLTPTQMKNAFIAAGGVVLSAEEEGIYAESDMAAASFLQTASAASNGAQQCPQQ